MKKLMLLIFLIIGLSLVHAELEVDIPHDMDIVGASFATTGPYNHETEWITFTNIGSTTETYTLEYSYENIPGGWAMSLCNHENCFMVNWPVPITLAPGEFEEIHMSISVASAGMFNINITFDEGDLTEPLVYDFTFRTEDYVVSAEEVVVTPLTLSNYPNPFNPSTTISYQLSSNDLGNASISIYNSKGQLVKTFNELNESGSVVWDGKDNNGNIVNSGVYLYKLDDKKTSQVRKMILIK